MFDIKKFLIDEKVENIKSYNNGEWLSIIIGTVRSKRHLSGLLKKFKCLKLLCKDAVFGVPDNEWVICSFETFDLHLFSPEKRDYYNLDQLWGQYEV